MTTCKFNAFGNPGQTTATVTYTYDNSTQHGGRLTHEDRYLPYQIPSQHTPLESTIYGYDDLGRQTSVEDQTFDSAHSQLTDRISRYAYDPITGNQTIDSTPEGTVHHIYDLATGHLTSTWTGPAVTDITDAQAQSISDAITRTDYTYDQFGRLATATLVRRDSTTIISDNVTRYTYDSLGSLHTTEEGLSSSDGANMGTASAIDKLFSRTTYDYNNLNELTDESVKKVDLTTGSEVLTPIAEYIYGYNNTGQRNAETDKSYNTDGSLFSTTTIQYTYDLLNRLVKEDHRDSSSAAETYIVTYTLDVLGNRLTETHDAGADGTIDTTTVSEYVNNTDELGSTKTFSGTNTSGTPSSESDYQYNLDGSTSSLNTSGPISSITFYGYDLRGRIIIEQTNIGGTLTYYTFVYDADGRRVEQVTKDSNGNVTHVQTKVIDDINLTGYNQILEVRTASSQVDIATTTPDTYLLGLDVTGQWVAAATSAGYYITDGHSSVRGFVSDNGGVDSNHWMDYDSFGVGLNFDVSAALSNIRFDGQWWDVALNASDNRARLENPNINRFFTSDYGFAVDPGNPITFNNFIFGNSNPISTDDPTGHEGELTSLLTAIGTVATLVATYTIPIIEAASPYLSALALVTFATDPEAAEQFIATGGDPEALVTDLVQIPGLIADDAKSLFVFGRGLLQDVKAMGIGGAEVRALQGAVSNARGAFFEQAAAESLGLGETNAQIYTGMTRNGPVNTVPDFPVGPQYGVTELKTSTNVVDTPQIRAEAAIAKENNVPFNIVISPDTQSISGTVIGRVEDTNGAILKFDDSTNTWTFIDPPKDGPWRRSQ